MNNFFSNVSCLANFVKEQFVTDFERQIGFFENHFKEFYNRQNLLVKKKIDWTLLLIKTTRIVPEKFFKHLSNTDGLWEVRVSADKKIFRIFCFFDKGNLIILLGGFQKKVRKHQKKRL